MSQSSLSIPNETFPQTRSDLNTALQALGSLQSGSSAPSTTYAYMWWADTTNGVLKQRDSSNSSWQIRATLSAAMTPAKTSSFNVALGDIVSSSAQIPRWQMPLRLMATHPKRLMALSPSRWITSMISWALSAMDQTGIASPATLSR